MNNLPVELKRHIVDFIFNKKEPYAQGIPSEAVAMAVADLKQLRGLRLLCSGDDGFLAGRFKTMKANDRETVHEARANLVRAIVKFRHYDVKFFQLPLLKTQRRSLVGFVERNVDLFSDAVFRLHDQRIDAVSAKITVLQRKQRVLLRRARA